MGPSFTGLVLLLAACGTPAGNPSGAQLAPPADPANTQTTLTTPATTEPATAQPATTKPVGSVTDELAATELEVREAATFAPIGTHIDDLPLPVWFKDGEVVADLMPDYMPVADRDGFIIGYSLNTLRFPELDPEELDEAGRHLIVDESGRVVGQFDADGVPVPLEGRNED